MILRLSHSSLTLFSSIWHSLCVRFRIQDHTTSFRRHVHVKRPLFGHAKPHQWSRVRLIGQATPNGRV